MYCCLKKFAGFLLILVVIIELGLILWIKVKAPVGLIGWVETDDVSLYYGTNAPDPPYGLSPEDRRLIIDMVSESHVLDGVENDFETIAALRNWSREICPQIEISSLTNDPSEILDAFKQGEGGACGAISTIYCAALIAHGYRARLLQLIRDPQDVKNWKMGPTDTHVSVEVLSQAHQKWIVSDPTFNCWFHLPDSNDPLSARELQLIALNPDVDTSQTGGIFLETAGAVVSEYDGYDTMPKTATYHVDPISIFNNVFLLYYDVFAKRPEKPIQKYSQLLTARFMGTEKVVWLLSPGEKTSHIVYFNTAANWLPVVAIFLLLVLLIPSGRRMDEEEEDEEEDDSRE